jgi:hypothetical protein
MVRQNQGIGLDGFVDFIRQFVGNIHTGQRMYKSCVVVGSGVSEGRFATLALASGFSLIFFFSSLSAICAGLVSNPLLSPSSSNYDGCDLCFHPMRRLK